MSTRDAPASARPLAAGDRQRVEAAIRRVLDNLNVSFRRDWPITVDSVGHVDFWLPADGPDLAGCAVLVADRVGNEEIAALTAVAEALDRAAVRYRAMVVVIAGEIGATHAAQLRHIFGREPLTAVGDSFEADFAAAVRAMLYRFDSASSAGAIARLPDQLDRLDRQQARTQDMLTQVAGTLGELRATALAAFRHPPRPDATGWPAEPVAIRTPAQVRSLFERALSGLDGLAPTAVTMGPVFDLGVAEPDSLTALRQLRNTPDEPLRGLGSMVLMRSLVVRFQSSVEEWFAALPPAAAPDADSRRRLRGLCGRYDEAYGWLPVRELHGLHRLPQGRSPGGTTWDERLNSTLSSLKRLAGDVRETALGPRGD